MSKLFACICIFLSFSVQASEIAGWDMQLVSCQNYDKFVFAGDVETYTGEIEFQTMEQTPSQDNIFVLCELKAEKKTGEEPLIAQSYKLNIDTESYNRIEDDYFLLDYHFRPLTHLPVKLGSHKGYVLFEIPKSKSNTIKKLFYNDIEVK